MADDALVPGGYFIPTAAPRPWAVMCCGCRGFLGVEGSIVERNSKAIDGGVLNLAALAALDWSKVRSFETKAEADAAATVAGWMVADSEGSNHRCPACHARSDRGGRGRGAFVPWGGGLL